jgi:hypothetical protein
LGVVLSVLLLAVLLLTAACGETATANDGGSGQENEPSVVFEMTLPEATQEPTKTRETPETASPEPNAEEKTRSKPPTAPRMVLYPPTAP